jgi:hypothetical protein
MVTFCPHSWYKSCVSPQNRLKLALFIFLLLVLIVPAPAFAYGDPSGGFLFQVLTPIVAALWGAWMAFAHNIHKRVAKALGRPAGVASCEHEEDAAVTSTLTQQVEQAGLED